MQDGESGSDMPTFAVGDRIRVVVKTVDLSKQALAAGLDGDDLVGEVTEVLGEEEGSGVSVNFMKPDGELAFEGFFFPDELEAWVDPSSLPAEEASGGKGGGGDGDMFVVADVLILPVGGLPDGAVRGCPCAKFPLPVLCTGAPAIPFAAFGIVSRALEKRFRGAASPSAAFAGVSVGECQEVVMGAMRGREGVSVEAHASGLTVVGEWESVMGATRDATKALLARGVGQAHMTIKVAASA